MEEKKQVVIQWSQGALTDFESICDWLMEDSVAVAERLADMVAAKLRRLATFPLSGRRVREVQSFGDAARQIVVGNYRIFYEYNKPVVRVLGISHGSRFVD